MNYFDTIKMAATFNVSWLLIFFTNMLYCAVCDSQTTNAATSIVAAIPSIISDAVPFCNLSAPYGGWYCAVDYSISKNVFPANTTDSCFCYMNNNETQLEAQASCALHGGYLADIRSSQENDLMQQLVYIDQQNVPLFQEQTCPANWTMFSGSCYKIFQYRDKWHQSEAFCWNNYQAHLPSIHSLAEFNFLLSLSNIAQKEGITFPIFGFWTGLTDETGTMLWTDGTPYNYMPPVGICTSINLLQKVTAAAGSPVNWMAIAPTLPCAYWHYDDILNVVCKLSPIVLPMWIGLQKTNTSVWNRGCEMKQLASQNYSAVIPATYKNTSNLLQPTTVSNGQTLNLLGCQIIF